MDIRCKFIFLFQISCFLIVEVNPTMFLLRFRLRNIINKTVNLYSNQNMNSEHNLTQEKSSKTYVALPSHRNRDDIVRLSEAELIFFDKVRNSTVSAVCVGATLANCVRFTDSDAKRLCRPCLSTW